MKKKYFAAGLAALIIGLASVATAQNLVDPATNDTDLSGYSNYLSRELADGFFTTDVVRTVVYREPVLATTTLDFQSQYGLPSINTRQLDYQHRRSGWRLAKGGYPSRSPRRSHSPSQNHRFWRLVKSSALNWYPAVCPQVRSKW